MNKVLIIGASSGIGAELARIFVQNGYIVGVTARREELLAELKKENPDKIFYKTFDVTDTQISITKLNELIHETGGVDIAVFCAGIGDLNLNMDFTIEKNTIDTNVTAFTNLACFFMNLFGKQKSGHFVCISSIAGLRGNGFAPSYNATKAFQINYMEGLRQKSIKNKLNICITDVRPGFVDTPMAKGDGLFWVAPVKKAALQIFKAVKNKKSVVYITSRWQIIAVVLKMLPRFVYEKI